MDNEMILEKEELTDVFDKKDEKNVIYETDATFDIVSKTAYLCGVPERFFYEDEKRLRLDIYVKLDKDKNARIIRNLCIIRTAIERGFKRINNYIKYENRRISSLTDCIPEKSLRELSEDGVVFEKNTSTKLAHHLIEINRLIADRINNCSSLYPMWINWNYVKNLFIMPNGLTEQGTAEGAASYYNVMERLPYRVYLNYKPVSDDYLFYNDRVFVSNLYESNNDYFEDKSKTADVNDTIKGSVYDFIEDSGKLIVMVDCENADPYAMYSVFQNLDMEYLGKIKNVILIDDVHANIAWHILDENLKVPVEHIMLERLKDNKSLADITLTSRTCQEFYQNGVDSFIIVSSDSDYWALIKSIPSARFLVMIEHEKCSVDMKNALAASGIFYCYTDDFYSGDTQTLKTKVILKEMYKYISEHMDLNAREMFETAVSNSRVEMPESEKNAFYDRYVRRLYAEIEKDGTVRLRLGTL